MTFETEFRSDFMEKPETMKSREKSSGNRMENPWFMYVRGNWYNKKTALNNDVENFYRIQERENISITSCAILPNK